MEYYIGCSGWHYKDWKGRFYPEELPQKEWLPYYAEVFSSVEINATFYKVPQEKTFERWRADTPPGFRFALKGSRYVTHLKKLKEVSPYVKDFYKEIEPLGEKIGCVLWQLPGNFKKTEKNEGKLEAFCKALPSGIPNALEFRHSSWFDEGTRNFLTEEGIVLCSVSASFDVPETLEVTDDTIYIRFHGKGEELYKYDYDDAELKDWANAIRKSGAEKVFVYFNNDYFAYGPVNAQRLWSMIRGEKA
ncbi:MAG: DUF72 domain-containing protein [Flavobacteriales bacterium]